MSQPDMVVALELPDELTSGGACCELEREIATIRPLRRPAWKIALFWLAGLASGTAYWLACLWSVSFRIKALYGPATLQDAQYMFVELRDKRTDICKIGTLQPVGTKPVRFFTFHTVRFIFSPSRGVFEAVPGVPLELSREMVAARRALGGGGYAGSPATPTRERRSLQYGDNLLAVPAPSFWRIFAHDALQPFNCFQYASVIIWALEQYYSYAVVVLIITMTSVVTNTVSQYRERARMAELAHYECELEVVGVGAAAGALRGPNGHALLRSSELIPGDVVVVSSGKMAFDGVLLEGECVMDETVLTGESVPVRKAAYDPELLGPTYNPDTFNQCTLFNGTIVSAVRGGRAGRPALAIVVSTGFNTAKGRLLRTIMFPRPHDLQFIRQAMYFIAMMFLVALGFYLWDVVAMVRLGVGVGTIILKALDMVTTAVPPALACCLAIATTISIARLRGHDVYVLDNERVALAGLLDAISFDKTGTLTEPGLELGGIVAVTHAKFAPQISEAGQLSDEVQELFAACHGLTQMGDTVVGDPLDQRLFEASGHEMRFEDDPPPAVVPPFSPVSEDAPVEGTGGLVGAPAAFTGPYLMLRRTVARGLPTSVHSADSMPGGNGRSSCDLQTRSSAHNVRVSLLGDVHVKSDGGSAVADAHGGSGGGGGVIATLARLPVPGLSARLSLSRRGSVDSPRRSHDGGAVISAAEHAAHIDPHHAPIHLATDHFHPQDSITVLRRFDFSSERLRSSAVVLHPDGRVLVYTKGSPEKLQTLMDPASIPDDFAATLQVYTNQGLRVIAIASREVLGLAHPSDVLSMTQDELEAGTSMLGLVLMVNQLKPESAPTIKALHGACIRTAMVTGDHVRTAVTVARQCAIMSPNAPALVMDVARGALNESDFTFEVMPGEMGQLPPTLVGPAGVNGQLPRPPSFGPPDEAGGVPPGVTPFSVAAAAAAASQNSSLRGGMAFAGGIVSHTAVQGAPTPEAQSVDLPTALRMAAGGEVQVAVTGRAWQKANAEADTLAELMAIVLQRGMVFARMNPDDKRSLIEQLGFGEVDNQGRVRPGCGYYTGYCGDGANDLGALKGALVGVSLCDTEASIAAPMTSRTPHIGVMKTVVAEGRCSMVTSLIIFKYTMVYAYIQVLTLALLYNLGITIGNYQYLLQDLFHTTLLATCLALTGPATELSIQRPLARVLSGGVILPVAMQMAVDTVIQLVALAMLYDQTWFVKFDPSVSPVIDIPTSEHRPENSVLFIVSTWQLIIHAMVFNVGHPFRRGIWSNPWLVASLLGLTIFNLYVLWAPADSFKRTVPAVVDMPNQFRSRLMALIIANLALAYLADMASQYLYEAGRAYFASRRGESKTASRLRAAALGLAPQAPPSMELQTSMSGATSGLLSPAVPHSTAVLSDAPSPTQARGFA